MQYIIIYRILALLSRYCHMYGMTDGLTGKPSFAFERIPTRVGGDKKNPTGSLRTPLKYRKKILKYKPALLSLTEQMQ